MFAASYRLHIYHEYADNTQCLRRESQCQTKQKIISLAQQLRLASRGLDRIDPISRSRHTQNTAAAQLGCRVRRYAPLPPRVPRRPRGHATPRTAPPTTRPTAPPPHAHPRHNNTHERQHTRACGVGVNIRGIIRGTIGMRRRHARDPISRAAARPAARIIASCATAVSPHRKTPSHLRCYTLARRLISSQGRRGILRQSPRVGIPP